VAAYLQQDMAPFIASPVTRTSTGQHISGKRYFHRAGPKKGQPMTGMGAEEACDMLDRYLKWRTKHCKRGQARRFLLVLDNDPTHKSEEFKAHCAAQGVDLCLLPPRSHDLSPPDSHFFAVAKNAWRQEMSGKHHLTWPDRKKLFRKQLLNTNVNPHVVGYGQRLEACKAAGGDRFPTQLADLRSNQGRGK